MGKGAGDALGKAGGIIGVANPLLGAGFGIAEMIAGAKEQREAQSALDAYQRQQFTNVADGLQVSTLGSDLQRNEQSRLASGQIEALRGAGTRGLIGGLGRVEAGNQRVMAETGANLDQQQKAIDQMYAEDQARIRGLQENREIADISALSSQYQSGKNDKNMGIGNIIQSTGMLGGALGALGDKLKGSGEGNRGGGFNLSGTGINLPNNYTTPTNMRFAPESGYADNFGFPNYQAPSQNVQQPYGFFNRYSYTPTYGPKNR